MFEPGRTYMWVGRSCCNWTGGKKYDAISKDQIETDRDMFRRITDPLTYKLFHLVSRDTEGQPKKHSADYEFKVGSPDIIDFDEIPLTRENPVVILKRSDGVHALLIHQSIWEKAYASGMEKELIDATREYNVNVWVPYSSKVLTNALSVIRKVRTAPFKNSKEVVCKVSYPKI